MLRSRPKKRSRSVIVYEARPRYGQAIGAVFDASGPCLLPVCASAHHSLHTAMSYRPCSEGCIDFALAADISTQRTGSSDSNFSGTRAPRRQSLMRW